LSAATENTAGAKARTAKPFSSEGSSNVDRPMTTFLRQETHASGSSRWDDQPH
jgi:hypothetical protein